MSNLYFDPGQPRGDAPQKVMLATTAYDTTDPSHDAALGKTRVALASQGIPHARYLLQGNCHVDDARNAVCRDFLASDCTDLIFLDADVSWEPKYITALLGFSEDVVGGVYPYRRDDFGKEKMPVRLLPGVVGPDERGLLEVEGLPTGFLRLTRRCIETMAEGAQQFMADKGMTAILFERDLFGGGRRGGDIGFCMRWRERGGRVWAAWDMRLGHVGKQVLVDSLAATLRRTHGMTLPHVAATVAAGRATIDTFNEGFKYLANSWALPAAGLHVVAGLARQAKGPILEIGTGLSTVVMAAAAPEQTVWAIEHDPLYALKLEALAAEAGVSNIAVVTAPLRDGWFALTSEDIQALPDRFALALVDGPPRALGDRFEFYKRFGEACSIIVLDDADEQSYVDKVRAWSTDWARDIKVDGRTGVILPHRE